MEILSISTKTNMAKLKVLEGPLAGRQKHVLLADLKKRRALLSLAAAAPAAAGAIAGPNKKPCVDDQRAHAASLWGEDALSLE